MINILVTGGCGYLGSNVCSLLANQDNYKITVIDSKIKNIVNDVEYYEFDINNLNQINKLFKSNKFNYVLHFAGILNPNIAEDDPFLFYESNINNTINLIKICLKNDVFKFIYSSSAAVYGKTHKLLVNENAELLPINIYGYSKVMCEKFIDYVSKKYLKFGYITLRHFMINGIGYFSDAKPSHFNPIDIVIDASINHSTVKIFGNSYDTYDGTCVRDYMHINDVSSLYLAAIQNFTKNKNKIMNASSSMPVSFLDVVNMVENCSKNAIKVEIHDKRESDYPYLVGKNDLAVDNLEWSPKSSDLKLIVESILNYRLAQNI